jgi:hypothetical protein
MVDVKPFSALSERSRLLALRRRAAKKEEKDIRRFLEESLQAAFCGVGAENVDGGVTDDEIDYDPIAIKKRDEGGV